METVKERTADLPNSIRAPLHSLHADAAYLIGRVAADGSFGAAAVISIRDRCDQIEKAVAAFPALVAFLRELADAVDNETLAYAEYRRVCDDEYADAITERRAGNVHVAAVIKTSEAVRKARTVLSEASGGTK